MQMHLEIITRSERCCSKFLFLSQKNFAKCDELFLSMLTDFMYRVFGE
jgi:hypothetical protein